MPKVNLLTLRHLSLSARGQVSGLAEHIDPNELIPLEELALSNMWENAAWAEMLERKGVLIRKEIHATINDPAAAAS